MMQYMHIMVGEKELDTYYHLFSFFGSIKEERIIDLEKLCSSSPTPNRSALSRCLFFP